MTTSTTSIICVLQRVRAFDPEEDNSIIKACRVGDFEAAISLCTDNKITDSNGWTLLHYACEHCQLKYISKLLELGCSPLHRDLQGTTPLHIACKYGLLESIQKFTKWPGYESSSLIDNKGYSPLHVACEYGQLDIVKLLISSGCDSTLSTEDGHSPLQIAVQQGEIDIVFELGKNGCDFRQSLLEKEQLSLFYKACITGHTYAVTQLIQSELISSDNFTAMFKQSALHLACRYGHGRVMHELISAGHDPESVDEDGCTALHVACKFGQAEIVKELTIVYRCNPFLKSNPHGVSPLDLAYQFNHYNAVEAILPSTNTRNIDINLLHGKLHHATESIPPGIVLKPDTSIALMLERTDRNLPFVDIATIRKEQLFMACKQGNFVAVKALIEDHNCDPTLPLNVNGQNPLHIACGYGHTEIVQYLLQVQNCDPTVKTSNGDTPFHFATNPLYVMGAEHVCNQVEILEALGQRFFYEHYGDSNFNSLCGNGNVKTPANSNHFVQLRRNAEMVKKIPFDPNEKNCQAMNPLHYASRNGLVDSVRILVHNLGCDIACEGRDGNTPLHFACLSGHLETVSFLMEFAPRVCTPVCKNYNKDTPLHFASASGEKDLVAFLIEQKGAKCFTSNAYGDTPLHEACRCGSLDIVRYLLEERKMSFHDLFIQNLLSIANVFGDMPLHVACCKQGNRRLVEYLVESKHCSLAIENNAGDTPLHKACEFGDLDIITYLIDKQEQCKIKKIRNRRGDTPLHTACTAGQSNVVEYLLSLQVWHPNISNIDGHTPLHLACMSPYESVADSTVKIVDLILHESATDPSSKDNNGHTPLMLSSSVDVTKLLLTHKVHKADISEVYMRDNPIIGDQHPGTTLDSSLNIFILGNQGVGKSTLIQCLQHHESLKLFKPVNISAVDTGKIGILPLKFISKYYGCVTLYDFVGQHESYCSHSAIIQNSQSCPSLFVLVLKLNEELNSIKHKLLYWLVFIRNQCCKALPQLVVVGSHRDQVHSSQYIRVQTVIEELQQSHCEEFTSVSYKGFVATDCRKSGSTSILTLRQTIQGIAGIQNSSNSTPMADYLLLYLKTVKTPTILLSDLMDCMHIDEQWFNLSGFEPNSDVGLPHSSSESIAHLCMELHQRGHLLFLKSKDTFSNSWIILDSQVLLSKVVGKVFTQESLSQYRCLSLTTGVVPLSRIKVMFPDLNVDMMSQFLSFLEFCYKVSDVMVLKLLSQNSSCWSTFPEMEGSNSERYLFFPGLLCTCAPENLWISDNQFKYHSGWTLQCRKPGHFFSPRFLHVLLLRLTFSFTVPAHSDELSEAEVNSPMLQRKCKVWKNGISWTDRDGVEALVEVTHQGKIVTAMFRCFEGSELYCICLRSAIIKYVHSAVGEFCPIVATSEHFLHPSEVLAYPLLISTPATVKFSMTEITQAICKGSSCVLSRSMKALKLTELLYFEPYAVLGEKVLHLLTNKNQQMDAKVTEDLLYCIAEKCSSYTNIFLQILNLPKCHNNTQIQIEKLLYTWKMSTKGTYHYLIECCDFYSIFAGRTKLLAVSYHNAIVVLHDTWLYLVYLCRIFYSKIFL